MPFASALSLVPLGFLEAALRLVLPAWASSIALTSAALFMPERPGMSSLAAWARRYSTGFSASFARRLRVAAALAVGLFVRGMGILG